MRKNKTGPVIIRGQEYPNLRQASIALGVSIQTVSQARKNNALDSVGLGRGNGKRALKNTVINGVAYPSRKHAAEVLGLNYSQLSTFLTVAKHLNINITE